MIYILEAVGCLLAGYILAQRHYLAVNAAERRGWGNGYAQAQKEHQIRLDAIKEAGQKAAGEPLVGSAWAQPSPVVLPEIKPAKVPDQFYEDLQRDGHAVWRRTGGKQASNN